MEHRDPSTLVGIFAHPDDELSMGGCFARYTRQGVHCRVACATRGDGLDAQISDPALATRETLGQVRVQELTCSCHELGIGPPIVFGWQDGELDALDVESAARAVVQVLRKLRPQVV